MFNCGQMKAAEMCKCLPWDMPPLQVQICQQDLGLNVRQKAFMFVFCFFLAPQQLAQWFGSVMLLSLSCCQFYTGSHSSLSLQASWASLRELRCLEPGSEKNLQHYSFDLQR